MKQIALNIRQGIAKLKIETQDDLWYLSHIIDPGDFVKGKTVRKIRKGTEEKAKHAKKAVFLKVEVGKVEFSKISNVLRVGGKIAEGPEDVARGAWHSFNIEPGTIISIEKKKWLSYQLGKLKEACKAKLPKILICVFDREEAYFALMKKYGYELLSHMKGKVQKKAVEEKIKASFYSDVIRQIEEYDQRYKSERIILASPAFWKEELMKDLRNEELKKKILLATCSSVGKNGIDEVIKRPETAEALKEERAANEINLVEKVLAEISKQGLAAYGMNETEQAAIAGAVETLLVTDRLIQEMREQGRYEKLDAVMRAVDSAKGSITIISSEHEGGKKLDGLGGIAAILRYRINY